MKNLFLLLALTTILFSSCLKDSCENMRTYIQYNPSYKNLDEIRNVTAGQPQDLVNPGQIYIYKQYLFINEFRKGIHVFDNSNPAQPVNLAFYDIPGNAQLSIKDNILYANNYLDLLAIDITDPLNINVIDVEEFIFMDSYVSNFGQYDTTKSQLIVEYIPTQITEKIGCEHSYYYSNFYKNGEILFVADNSVGLYSDNSGAQSNIGVGGSTAKFTISGNALYTLRNQELLTFDIAAKSPVYASALLLKVFPETVFPFKNTILVGGATGMTIINIDNPLSPVEAGSVQHIRSCDPVVASGNLAYVTLWNGSECGNGRNELQVIDISNLNVPVQLNATVMESPRGLAVSEGKLMVCEDTFGAKLFDVSDNTKPPQKIASYPEITSQDVIWIGSNFIFVSQNGIAQYKMDGIKLDLLSTIPIKP